MRGILLLGIRSVLCGSRYGNNPVFDRPESDDGRCLAS